jgi:TRAP-type uncharacterized transport system fused permease subunit
MEGNAAFIIFSFATAFVGTIALSAAMEGFLLTFLSPLSRIALLAGSVLLLISNIPTDIAGVILLVIAITLNYRSSKKIRHSDGNFEVAG